MTFPTIQPQDLHTWWGSTLGQYVLEWERKQCDQIVADIFGYFSLQVGTVPADLLRTNRMPTRVYCQFTAQGPSFEVKNADGAEDIPGSCTAIRLHPEQLPIAGASLDLLVLPHVLEFSDNPHQILREAERVLIPEGHLLVIGFNPYSFWGWRNRFSGEGRGNWPRGSYVGLPRLRDWFPLLGFTVERGGFGCYAPPLAQEQWRHRFRFLEWAGDRWWPFAGAVYLMLVVKRVPGMRLIVPSIQRSSRKVERLAPVTQKGQSLPHPYQGSEQGASDGS